MSFEHPNPKKIIESVVGVLCSRIHECECQKKGPMSTPTVEWDGGYQVQVGASTSWCTKEELRERREDLCTLSALLQKKILDHHDLAVATVKWSDDEIVEVVILPIKRSAQLPDGRWAISWDTTLGEALLQKRCTNAQITVHA